MAEQEERIPILLGSHDDCSVTELPGLVDGFRDIADILNRLPEGKRRKARRYLEEQHAQDRLVWRDEWSPLRWCHSCGLPLLQERCGRCGRPGSELIELKFPCNPRPLLPHDEAVFREAGLPWPVTRSVLLNTYRRPDHMGWEVVCEGKAVGSIVSSFDATPCRFEPSDAYREGMLAEQGSDPGIEDFEEANRSRLTHLTRDAVDFIRTHCRSRRFTFPVTTFSGGKDSAVLAHVCHQSGVKMRVMQIDTGIDPDGNESFSERLLSAFGNLKHRRIDNDDMFWRAMEKLGPPAYDFQWCRTVLKNSAPYRTQHTLFLRLLEYVKPILRPLAVLVDGPRRREEPWRITLDPLAELPESPVDAITIRPILDFTDLDVWMYIHRHDIPVNPTYTEHKHQRLLCLFCPEQNKHEFEMVKQQHSEKWEQFEQELWRWQERLELPEAWVTENLWVVDKHQGGRGRELDVDSRVEAIAEHLESCVETNGAASDGLVMEAEIKESFDVEDLARWLQPLGTVQRPSQDGQLTVESAAGRATISSSGEIQVEGRHDEKARHFAHLLKHWIVSYVHCIGCGNCRAACDYVETDGDRARIRKGCPPCPKDLAEAIRACPVNGHGLKSCFDKSQNG